MAPPVDGSADSDLSVNGLTVEELTIRPDHELQEDSDGELKMRRMRMNACTLFSLAKISCKSGACRSGRLIVRWR